MAGLGQSPFGLWPVALVALSGIAWFAARLRTARAGFAFGWASGFGYFALSMAWIVEPFFVDAALTGVLAPVGVIGLSGGLALFWGAAFALAARFAVPLLALAPLWAAAELARGYVLTGFPWGQIGYILSDTPAAQLAAVIGPFGLTLLVTATAAALAAGITRHRWLVSAGAILGVAISAGHALRPPPDDGQGPIVRLVQPNAAQDVKWDAAHVRGFFDAQVAATAAPGAPVLTVWPETAVPFLAEDGGAAFAMIADAAEGRGVVLGAQRRDADGRYYNSAVLLDAAGQVADTYDKHHLVPFGEYMPFPKLFARIDIAGLAARATGGFTPGPGPRLMQTPVGPALPLICYEAVFPQDVRAAPSRPRVLIQLTNDAWFGDWAGPQQHLMQARMRAIESGLPLIRAANTGVSAVIDPAGRIVARLGLGQAGHVDAPLPSAAAVTPYWRFGDLPLVIVLALWMACAAFPHLWRGRARQAH